MNKIFLVLLILLSVMILFAQETASEIAVSTEDSMKSSVADSSAVTEESAVTDKSKVSPLMLTLLGMVTVFAGLLLMQVFINIMKLILNPPPKKTEVTKEEEVNKGLLSNVELTEDEMVATITAVLMESKLHHAVSNDRLTLKWADKSPHWFSTRRR